MYFTLLTATSLTQPKQSHHTRLGQVPCLHQCDRYTDNAVTTLICPRPSPTSPPCSSSEPRLVATVSPSSFNPKFTSCTEIKMAQWCPRAQGSRVPSTKTFTQHSARLAFHWDQGMMNFCVGGKHHWFWCVPMLRHYPSFVNTWPGRDPAAFAPSWLHLQGPWSIKQESVVCNLHLVNTSPPSLINSYCTVFF